LVEDLRENLANRNQQDEAELKRLRAAEASHLVAEKSWKDQKEAFEKDETRLEAEFDGMREERNKVRNDLAIRDEELKQALRSKEEAEANFGSLVREKESVDGMLKDQQENGAREKARADLLEVALSSTRQESEDRQRQIEELRRQIAVPRSLDAGGREQMELFSLRQEAENWKNWRNNRIAEVQKLTLEQESLQRESDDRRKQIEKLEKDAQFSDEMELQLNEQVLALTAYNESLQSKILKFEDDSATKDAKIAKLERKEKLLTQNFEWVQGRYLEYYGQHYISSRDNQLLRECNSEIGEALQRMTAALAQKTNRIAHLRDGKNRLDLSLDGANNLAVKLSAENHDLQMERDNWDSEKAEKDDLIGQMRTEEGSLLQKKADLEAEKSQLEKSVEGWKKSAKTLEAERLPGSRRGRTCKLPSSTLVEKRQPSKRLLRHRRVRL